jgi:ankyrin repeat protein
MVTSPEIGFLNACKEGNTELVKKFLEEDQNLVHLKDGNGISAFLTALYHRQKKVAAILLVFGAELDLFEAASIGNRDLLGRFLDKIPALVGSYSNDGWTPLHLAAFFGHAASVKFLLERGADPAWRSKNVMENTPLHSACAGGHTEAVEALLMGGADPNALAKGWSPLHLAAGSGHLSCVQALVLAKADPALRNAEGKTAHDLAREGKHTATAEFLKPKL